MSASSGWDYRQPPAPLPAQPPYDHNGEPLGYNLDDSPLYEQPPVPQPYGLAAVAPLSSGFATTGFALSIGGLASAVMLPVVMVPLAVAGIGVSATALRRCRRGLAAGRRLAIAGLVLGILGVVLALLVVVAFSSFLFISGQ